MNKIYCEIHLFTLEQNIYVIDGATGQQELVAKATVEDLPAVINAVCDSKKIYNVSLTGNPVFGLAVAEDIKDYAKTYYSWNNIEVEVYK